MKNLIVLLFLLFPSFAFQSYAEDKDVPPPIKRTDTEKNKGHRAPAVLPVEIVYNTETGVLRITSWGDDEAEVYILGPNEEVENYSPTLNCELLIPTSGLHTIYIQGDGWSAVTEFSN